MTFRIPVGFVGEISRCRGASLAFGLWLLVVVDAMLRRHRIHLGLLIVRSTLPI